jgi:hypothetical protein
LFLFAKICFLPLFNEEEKLDMMRENVKEGWEMMRQIDSKMKISYV